MDFLKTVPSDNLYKFMAIGGLATSFGFFWLFSTTATSLNDRVAIADMNARVFNARNDAIQKRIAEGDELAKDELAELVVEEAKVRSAIAAVDLLNSNTKIGLVVLTVAGSIAFLVSIWGFGLWYWLVQRYLDAELHRKAETQKETESER